MSIVFVVALVLLVVVVLLVLTQVFRTGRAL